MRRKLFLIALLPIILSSCGQSRTSTSSSQKPEYDFTKPTDYQEVSEARITLGSGNKMTIKQDANQETLTDVFNQLKPFRYYESNWDSQMTLTSPKGDDGQAITAKGKCRYTNNGNKKGYYQRYVSGQYVVQEASTSADAAPYQVFSYEKDGDEIIALFGRILSEEKIDEINSHMPNGPFLYKDPDYEPGIYSMKDKPNIFSAEMTTQNPNDRSGYILFNTLFNNFQRASFILLNPVRILTYEAFEPKLSHKVTDKYLILDIEKPYGFIDNPIGNESVQEALYDAAKSHRDYVKIELFFDLNDGGLVYAESSFKSRAFSARPGFEFAGKMVLKTQKESDEGYNEYMRVRKEVMDNANQKDDSDYNK